MGNVKSICFNTLVPQAGYCFVWFLFELAGSGVVCDVDGRLPD